MATDKIMRPVARASRSPRARKSTRQGVLMLVVLSMLVLFMLIGTAFLMSSSQEQKTATAAAKNDRVGNFATKLLDRALLHAVRDSDNPYSSVRYHSLLRDLYGTNGFQGVVYSPATMDITTTAGQVTRYAAATAGTPAAQLGPTNGQFIDLYVRALGWDPTTNASLDDPLTPGNENNGVQKLIQPDLRHVLKLDRDPLGQGQMYVLPLTKGYFNGQLLTITSGPAAGQTTRILDYDVVLNKDGTNYIDPSSPAGTPPVFTRIFRFRVMPFSRTDGGPLQINQTTARSPEIVELAGATFMVNGRAFSGTGAGYNPLAAPGQPRLDAVQLFPTSSTEAIGAEIALLPNSAYFNPLNFWNVMASPPLGVDPFNAAILINATASKPGFIPLNTAVAGRGPTTYSFNYGLFGDMNESYDATDFQNMFLALLTVTPRAQGRVVQDNGGTPTTLSVDDPGLSPKDFLRLDLEDLPIPSFHRPDLVNYWYHRILNSQWLTNGSAPTDENVRAIFQPFDSNGVPQHGLTAQQAALITAIKRQSSLRPLHDDHPDFDPSNQQSVLTDRLKQSNLVKNSSIAIPYWEAVGPWDVDNDNDGVPDSVWVDIGDSVQEAEDGTRYKALYAYLIVDLDSRLNVNAHGLADDIVSPLDDPTRAPFFDSTVKDRGWIGNIAHDTTNTNANALHSTLQLSRGLGYGPAEISLRPVFPTPIINPDNQPPANRDELAGPIDDYATVLFGRRKQDGTTVAGKYGFDPNMNFPHLSTGDAATAGMNYRYAIRRPNWLDDPASVPDAPMWYTGEQASPTLIGQLKFFDYPWSSVQWRSNQSAFGTLPDLKGRYALGLDYFGQPVNEGAADVNPNTPTNKQQPFNLLAKNPYELDITSGQRRDEWAANTNSLVADNAAAFTQSLTQNDDAAFSPSDLEKVLRGWDPDIGTLPSRLWDDVDAFDPVKLIRFNPNNTANFANDLLDPTNRSIGAPANNKEASAEMMTGAQQLASINRRLVTTDSFDLPVISASMPNLVGLAVGPDGFPGRAGINDDPDGPSGPLLPDSITDNADEIGAPGSDDFKAVIGKDPAQATIVDLLQYRVWTSARQYEMRRQQLTEVTLAAKSVADYKTFMDAVTKRVNLITTASPNIVSDLLAPEVIAGKKMDLNRPFGDGRDNNGDGVVDDPLEAGEPFVDLNGNGKWDTGEPYIDLDGNHAYTPPGDQLWSNLTSATGPIQEPIAFDYTNGHSEPLSTAVASALTTALSKPVLAGVRNLESEGRQLFARHLYCLMLLLTDENYIIPIDERNPQLKAWVTAETTKLTGANPIISAADAAVIIKRKLTCRMIAQWAINVVDTRDADAIMTPFEFDEKPWDGWGVWNDAWTKDVTDNAVASSLSFIPLDGDPATNESNAEVIDWPSVIKNTASSGSSNINTKKLTVQKDSAGKAIVSHPLNQTRGIVWGAERPELLMTETLAFHDRRTEDLASNDSSGHGEMKHYDSPGEQRYKDPDPDQSLRPHGSLFVEVYNPWSTAGQLPAELYSRINTAAGGNAAGRIIPSKGVELGRLSNFAWDDDKGTLTLDPTDATKKIKRSPVWRITVVEEQPGYRNSDKVDALGHGDKVLASGAATPPKPAAAAATPSPTAGYFVASDPDFDAGGDMAAFVPTQATPGNSNNVNSFKVQFPYEEREFYFTTDKSPQLTDAQLHQGYDLTPDYNYADNSFKLRIPYRAVKINYPGMTKQPKPGQTQKFIAPDIELATRSESPIAPILPGRYGVIGSAGAKYGTHIGPQTPFITTIGRGNASAGNFNTADNQHVPPHTRRIELRPSNDPEVPQVMIANNGGDPADEYQSQVSDQPSRFDPTTIELGRDNELIYDSTVAAASKVANITSSTQNAPNGEPVDPYYQPCVAIPVAGMNVSEPAWGYAAREYQAAKEQAEKKTPPGNVSILTFHTKPTSGAADFEGRYYDGTDTKDSYDRPFDLNNDGKNTMAPELERTGSTPNYRTLHLQRLANPQLPWNPPPGQYFEPDPANPTAKKDMNRPNMPINPYRTIDTASVNLTAFNGVSECEANYPSQAPGYSFAQSTYLQMRPWILSEVPESTTAKGPGYLKKFETGDQVWYFRSTERGFAARLNAAGLALNPIAMPQQRLLWPQEPAMLSFKKDADQLLDMMPGRQVTMRVTEVPGRIKTDQEILTNQMDMVLEHSLGFGNKSWGLLYDKKGTKKPGVQPASTNYPANSIANLQASSVAPVTNSLTTPQETAAGAPAPFFFTWDTNGAQAKVNVKTPKAITSTDPWLTWNNRPFVSAEELLQVPCASSSELLAAGHYSTIDPSSVAATGQTINPYGQDGRQGTAAVAGATPAAAVGYQAEFPFGHLMNFFAAVNARKDAAGNLAPAPQFYRILDFVHVPSRFVGTDTLLNAETFNDVNGTNTNDSLNVPGQEMGSDLTGSSDPRYNFQPPFNKVAHEREPGKVNLNTVTGRRIPGTTTTTSTNPAQIWSEVYDGIMHRLHDANSIATQLAQPGPAWRDVVLSRRGYVQVDALGNSVDKPRATGLPDTFQFGLNNSFPTMFANPFRAADAADLVPVPQMLQYGVDATMLRGHPYAQGVDKKWGNGTFGDARDAGFGDDVLPFRTDATGAQLWTIPSANFTDVNKPLRGAQPLFSEARADAFSDTDRNPYMMYQPMSRLGNLVTDHSNVYAIWITVGYFEVEKAPDWNSDENKIQERMGGDGAANSAATAAALTLYNRVYPDGYMLGKELGSDTGDVKRPRGFYIIDRTEPVGFRPGEDLNVEKTIRLRRRIQ